MGANWRKNNGNYSVCGPPAHPRRARRPAATRAPDPGGTTGRGSQAVANRYPSVTATTLCRTVRDRRRGRRRRSGSASARVAWPAAARSHRPRAGPRHTRKLLFFRRKYA